MSTVAKRKIEKAERTGTPDKGATFSAKGSRKSQRKAARKAMVGPVAFVKNKIADARLDHQEKQKFYKKLRMMKINRKNVAKAVRGVERAMLEVGYELQRAYSRLPRSADPTVLQDAIALYNRAHTAIDNAATEHEHFARQDIYYTKQVAA